MINKRFRYGGEIHPKPLELITYSDGGSKMIESRYIDRAELFNRLATLNTEDVEYKAKVYTIIGDLPGFEAVKLRCKDCEYCIEINKGEAGVLCVKPMAPIDREGYCFKGRKRDD